MQDLTPSKSLNQELLLHSFIVIVFFFNLLAHRCQQSDGALQVCQGVFT